MVTSGGEMEADDDEADLSMSNVLMSIMFDRRWGTA